MTRASDQQKKQRQKEFRERKEHQEMLKAMSKKAKREAAGTEDEKDKIPHDGEQPFASFFKKSSMIRRAFKPQK